MDPVGAMKSMMGMVGSNLVSSAKHATKQVVSKIRRKADPVSYTRFKKNKGRTDNGRKGEDSDVDGSDNSGLHKRMDEDKRAGVCGGSNEENQEAGGDASEGSSDDESILDFRDRVVTEQEFKRLRELLSREIKVTNRGNSEMEKQVWLTPRRFRTTIRSVQVENLTRVEQKNVFLEFSFGGTLTEVRLLNSNTGQEVPRLLGYPPCREFYTHTVDIKPFQVESNGELLIDIPDEDSKEFMELKNSNSVDISLDETFEWRGSYLHLERELFRIIAWRANAGTVNDMLGYNEDILKNYATGSVSQMITLSKVTQNNTSSPIFRVTLQIVFQEIYDFQLSLSQFTLRNIDASEGTEVAIKSENANAVYGNQEMEYGSDEGGRRRRRRGSDQVSASSSASVNDQSTIRISLSDHEGGSYENENDKLIKSHSTSCRLNIRFPSFGMDNPFPIKCTSSWSECYDKQNKLISWDNIGMIPFRGTIHELERNSLQATLEINSVSKVRQIFKSSKQVSSAFSLKNIVYYPYVQTELKLPDGEACILEGKIDFGNIPKYHQLGNILEIDDENKIYLVVKVIRIDNLILNVYEANNILQEPESDDSMDIYVQLSFDGNRKETPVVSGTLHPLFQTELTFILDNIDHEKSQSDLDAHSLVKLLERKGPIMIDVWRKNKSAMAQHLGWTEIHWKDILLKSNSSGGNRFSGVGDLKLNQLSPLRHEVASPNLMDNAENACTGANMLRRQEYRKFYDRNLGKEVVYETRVYQDGALLYSFGQRPSSLRTYGYGGGTSPRVYLEIWTKPDLSGMYNISSGSDNRGGGEVSGYLVDRLSRIVDWSGIGPSLKNSKIRSNIFYWEFVTKSFETWGRQYSYYSLDARGIRHLLPSFLQPLKPLTGVDNASKVHHFVHSFPFLPSGNDNKTWRTPDLFLLSRQGTPFDHTLLQVCLLLGLNRVAFLACGTLLSRDPYSWAVTIHYEYVMSEGGNFCLDHEKKGGNGHRGRNKVQGAAHLDRNKGYYNIRSISPGYMKSGERRSNRLERMNGVMPGSRGKMRSLSPRSVHIDQKLRSARNNSKSTETVASRLDCVNSGDGLVSGKKSIRFYALFWDTVKHVVYRVDNIIQASKHDEFMNWLREEGYDINQLNEFALESLFSRKGDHRDSRYKSMQYKPNFCLKVVNKLPYRTLDLLVNDRNIYANVQQVNNPLKLSYNLNDSKQWFPFFPRKMDHFVGMNMSDKIQREMNVKGVLNQLPLTQNSSNVSACFSWPVINVVTQTNDKIKKSHKGGGDCYGDKDSGLLDGYWDGEKAGKPSKKSKDGGVLSPTAIFGLKKPHHNRRELDDSNSMERKFLENSMVMNTEVDLYCRSINDEIMRYVQIQRFQKSRTIGTRWNRENNNMVFLRMGLKLLGKWEMSDPYTREYDKNKCEFLKWRESFLSTVPAKYRMKYAILTFPCNIPKWIAQQVWFKCSFLSNETDKRSVFSLSIDVDSWPNNIQTIRILILVVHPLKPNQLRKLQLLQKMDITTNGHARSNQSTKNNNFQVTNTNKVSNSSRLSGKQSNDIYAGGYNDASSSASSNNNNNIERANINCRNSDGIISELDQFEIPEFPKELVIKGDNNSNSNAMKNRHERRVSSIIFSDDEPELKLLQP